MNDRDNLEGFSNHGSNDDQSPFQQFASRTMAQQQYPDSLMNQPQNFTQGTGSDFFLSGGESLLSKMGGMLIAKAFLPTGNHIKQALSYLDLAIKVEIVLHELQSTLFWFAVLEIGLFLLSMFLFFSNPTEMYHIWFHMVHCVRGTIGFIISKKLPRSHQMAANMSIPPEDKMPIEDIMRYILLGAKDALTDFTSTTRNWLLFYFISTVVCLFLDLTSFFIQVKDFAFVKSAFADLALLTLASIFLFIDWFYILWIVTLSYKFPSYISVAFIKSLFGMVETIHEKLGNYINESKQKYDYQFQEGQRKYRYISQQQTQIQVREQGPDYQRQARNVNYPQPTGFDSSREQ